jgi:hypothetical protein
MKYMKDGEVAVHIEWHLPLSGVHSMMMEKLAQPGGGCMPTPPHSIYTITYKVVVYASAERTDTLPRFYSILYVLCGMGLCQSVGHWSNIWPQN